jgi:hypothetical protein
MDPNAQDRDSETSLDPDPGNSLSQFLQFLVTRTIFTILTINRYIVAAS